MVIRRVVMAMRCSRWLICSTLTLGLHVPLLPLNHTGPQPVRELSVVTIPLQWAKAPRQTPVV